MSDLDARVVVKKSNCFAVLEGNNVIASFVGPFAEENAEAFIKLQKPALHEPPTGKELQAFLDASGFSAYEAGKVEKGLESFLQGRAQPADKLEAENRFEHYVQNMIDHAPEPLRRLGEYLSRVLDEDEWATAERMILGVEETKQPAQEEITGEPFVHVTHDAGYPELWLSKFDDKGTARPIAGPERVPASFLAAIRASKGEKT